MLSTKPTATLPWQASSPQQPAPAAPDSAFATPASKPGLPPTSPFGRSTAAQMRAEAPVGQPSQRAVPVENIDHIDEKQTEAAPPAPPAAGEDPAKDDPAMPTELTAPLFNEPDTGAPRTIVIRALNKVTAQSQLLEGAPGKPIKFGQLIITPVTCRVSDSTSQRDDAALLDIKENIPGKEGTLQRFKGWMYASSPSVNALEHPVYDISAVECKIISANKDNDKTDKAGAKKSDKKPAKKG